MKHIKPFRDGEPRWFGKSLGEMRKVYRCVDSDLTESQHISMGITIFEPGEGSNLHSHGTSEEIAYVISGGGCSYGEGGELLGRFAKGDVIYYGQGEAHKHVNDTEETLMLLWMHPVAGASLKE